MYSLLYSRDWFNDTDVEDGSTLVYDAGRRTAHSPALNPSHFHNFIYKTPYPQNFKHLSVPGIKDIISHMTNGLPENRPLGNEGRDTDIMQNFLRMNRADKVIQINMNSTEKMVPGGAILLDSLVVDSKTSRWSIPSKHYLSQLRKFRSVDQNSLEQVDYLKFYWLFAQYYRKLSFSLPILKF